MTFKEIFHISNLFNKIKLDRPEVNQNLIDSNKLFFEEKKDNEKFPENEWNQEYELIYASYILEK
jgi:hypothetical protein